MKKYYDNTIVKDIELNITNKNYSKALYIAEQYVEDYPEDRLGPVYKARAMALTGNLEDAREMFENAISSKLHDRSSYLIAYTWYGLTLLSLNYQEEGKEKLLTAISIEDNHVDGLAVKARLTLCNLYVEEGEFDKALEIINIETIDKNMIYTKRSYIYLMMGDYEQAIKYGKKVRNLKSDKNQQMNNYNIGKAYYCLRDYEQAKMYLSRCLTTKTRHYYSALSVLGRISYYTKDYDMAYNYANQVLASEDLKEDGYRLLFKINARLGKIKEAKDALDHINNYIDKQYYTQYYYFLCGDYEKALESIPHALCKSTGKRTYELFRSYISLLMRTGKYDKAEYFINCVEKDLHTPFTMMARAFIDKARGIVKDDAVIYTAKQVYNYNEDDTILHILNHHLLGDSSKFFDKDSIREVLHEMKDKIQNMQGIPDGLSDRYLVHYDNIGYDESGILNSLEVVTNQGTTDIITIYPLSGADIYEEEEIRKPKELKRESQIDKFNRRYGNK